MKIFNEKNLILFFSFFLLIIICEMPKKEERYKCGIDKFQAVPIPATNISPLVQNNQNNGRLLDSDGFKEFEIFLDLVNLNYEIDQNGLQEKRDFFIIGI